ncbi:MAG: alkaline phosphatase family protein [Candidatus Aenigmatarchaeota archaeon]
MKKTLMIILDGVADVGNRTPLMLASKPNIDWLASHSECGLWKPSVPKNYSLTNFSEIGTLELLGCFQCPGRGYLEALGIGLKPDKKAVYFRANFATVRKIKKGYKLIDRRAGRDETGLDELTKAVNKIKIKGANIKFYKSSEHRGVLVIRQKGSGNNHSFSKNDYNITDADLGKTISYVKALDKSSKKMADILNEFMDKSYDVLNCHKINKKRKLAANFLLLRGAGHYLKVRPFEKVFGSKGAVVSDARIIDGIAKFLGLDVYNVKGADGGYDSNIKGQIDKTLELLGENSYSSRKNSNNKNTSQASYDINSSFAKQKSYHKYNFVLLHIKGTDIASHDKNPKKKKDVIEKFDKEFARLLKLKNINIIVTADHITSSKTGMHENGNVPFILYDPDNEIYCERKFHEHGCRDFVTKNPMRTLINQISQ